MKTFLLIITALLINLAAFCQSGSELIFMNPVLVSGTANTPGAVYRFNNVTSNVDAEVKISKFSRNDIVMSTIDNGAMGFNKAFQPEFGLTGNVAPNQNWYVDFEMIFYKGGTNNTKKMNSVKLTAIDVDGDALSIKEYVTYDRPTSISYSLITLLSSIPTGLLGETHICDADNIASPLVSCTSCGGDGYTNSGSGTGNECGDCQGSGKLHDQCDHAFKGISGSIVNGPVLNFLNIDTLATQVMTMYEYQNVQKIKFRYGAKSGLLSSSAGVRMNSTWFREFSLAPLSTLPVKLTSFTATLNNNKVDLKWTTASEINVSHFIVEKSTDGISYSDAGMAFAYGNATDKTNYTLSDNNINTNRAAVIYYRLRSVDIDGKNELSETRIIRIGKQNENNITIVAYPNPVNNEVRITIPADWQNKQVSYELVSANGQPVKRTVATNSSQTETINTSSLTPGFYFVRVMCEGQVAQQKIIKN
ncbi:hypothetical protein CAP36_17130 [Chitinophagaceae bacterium IBVUCB2]|nr:hypothetical protein CAP36_17130 [Chitinophagaceae bacterium IBVUCB2]